MRILLIDDEKEIREVLTHLLGEQDILVVECNSGYGGIEHLKEDDAFDLIISDFQMTNGDGNFVIKQMNEKGFKIPLYIFTGEFQPSLQKSHLFQIRVFAKTEFSAMLEEIKQIKDILKVKNLNEFKEIENG
jgi:DNA-binding NtrC family response regulator